jgi:hypothetical protein
MEKFELSWNFFIDLNNTFVNLQLEGHNYEQSYIHA